MLTNERLKEIAEANPLDWTAATRTGEIREIASELLALREAVAPKMEEVDVLVRQIVSCPQVDNYIPAMRLASMLRFSILYAKREHRRADHKNDQLESQLALVSTLTAERDEAQKELTALRSAPGMEDVDKVCEVVHDAINDYDWDRDCEDDLGALCDIARRAIVSRDELIGLLKFAVSADLKWRIRRQLAGKGDWSEETKQKGRRILEIVEGK